MIRTLVFKNVLKSVISILCCRVSVGQISLHLQTFILPTMKLLIRGHFCLTAASAPHRDLGPDSRKSS